MSSSFSKVKNEAYLVQLLQDNSLHDILCHQLIEMGEDGLIVLEKAINSSGSSSRLVLIDLYYSIKYDVLLKKAKFLTSKYYFTLEEVTMLLNRILFDIGTAEEQQVLQKISQISNTISDKLESSFVSNELEILGLLDSEISTYFIVENSDQWSLFALNHVFTTYKVNQITLSLIYLIIAQKTNIPIFGIPLDDRIVLCYTQPYCPIYELVTVEDVLFYFNPGIKDSIYSYYDILDYSSSNNLEIIDDNLLPKSNNLLIQQWMKKIELNSNSTHYNDKFSSCYQQVQNLIKYS